MSSLQRRFPELAAPSLVRTRGGLDPASEALIERYTESASAGRQPATVRGEVSQLRSLVRIARGRGGPQRLPELLADVPALADALTNPSSPISESTGRCRLRAVERALLLDVPREEGRSRQDHLYEALPKRATRHWHESGVSVAGSRARRRVQSATVEPDDLYRIIDASPAGRNASQAARNHALVGLHCFSGLQASEIRTLRRGQVTWDPAIEGWRACVTRGTRQLELPILGPGAAALARWLAFVYSSGGESRGSLIFPGTGADDEPLSDQQIHNLIRAATSPVGFEHAGRTELRSAFAAWCRATFELTDHELAQVLGAEDVGTVDRLLYRQRIIEWQRQAAMGSQSG